jgi:ribosomal 50S subunit-recycling heat shock protein
MRLDKFLKVSRIFKRRSVAKEVALMAKVLINGRVGKPSSDVNIDDLITIIYQNKEITIKVLDISLQQSKDKAASMYEIIGEKIL